MKKICLLIVLSFSLVGVSFAKEVSLEKLYGEGLYSVPTVVRLKFQNETGMAWHDASEEERREFLKRWEEIRSQVSREKIEEAKKIADEKKKLEDAKKERLKKEKERVKALKAIEKAKADEKRARDEQLKAMRKKQADARKRLRNFQRDHD